MQPTRNIFVMVMIFMKIQQCLGILVSLEQSFKHLYFSPYTLSEQSHFSNCQKCVPAKHFLKSGATGKKQESLNLVGKHL